MTNTRATSLEAQTIEFSHFFGVVQIGVSIISPEMSDDIPHKNCLQATSHMVDLATDLQGQTQILLELYNLPQSMLQGCVCGGGEGFSVHVEDIMKEARRWIVAYGIIE